MAPNPQQDLMLKAKARRRRAEVEAQPPIEATPLVKPTPVTPFTPAIGPESSTGWRPSFAAEATQRTSPLPAAPELPFNDRVYRDYIEPIDRWMGERVADAGNALRYSPSPMGQANRQTAKFIDENVAPVLSRVGAEAGGLLDTAFRSNNGGRTGGPAQEMGGDIGSGLGEWGATTFRDPARGVAEAALTANEMLNPVMPASRAVGDYSEAGGAALRGDWKEAGKKFGEGNVEVAWTAATAAPMIPRGGHAAATPPAGPPPRTSPATPTAPPSGGANLPAVIQPPYAATLPNLTPRPAGPAPTGAAAQFQQLHPKVKAAITRIMTNSGMDAPAIQRAVVGLDNLPKDRVSQYFTQLIHDHGQQYPDLMGNLQAVARKLGMDAPTGKGDIARNIFNESTREVIGSEGPYIAKVAEENFGPGSVPTREAIDQEIQTLRGEYRKFLDPNKPYGAERSAANIQRIDAARKDLASYLKQVDSAGEVPEWLKRDTINTLNRELRDMGFEPIERGPISSFSWAELVDRYPTQLGHALQSTYATAARDARAAMHGDMKAGALIRDLDEMRGRSQVRANAARPADRGYGLLHLLEQATPKIKGGKTYKETRLEYGSEKGAELASTLPEKFLSIGEDEVKLADFLDDLDDLTPRQRQAAENQITTLVRNEMSKKIESPNLAEVGAGQRGVSAPNLTRLSRSGPLNALEKAFGEKGKTLADAIRHSRANTDFLTETAPKVGSKTGLNLSDAEGAGRIYEHPLARDQNIIDTSVSTLTAAGGLASVVNPAVGLPMLGAAAGKALYNAWKNGLKLSAKEKSQLADWLFAARRSGEMPPHSAGPQLPGPATPPSMPSGGPGAPKALAPPPPIPPGPPPVGAKAASTPPRSPPVKNGFGGGSQTNMPPELGGAIAGGVAGYAAAPEDNKAAGAAMGALGGAGVGRLARGPSRVSSIPKIAEKSLSDNAKSLRFSPIAPKREPFGPPGFAPPAGRMGQDANRAVASKNPSIAAKMLEIDKTLYSFDAMRGLSEGEFRKVLDAVSLRTAELEEASRQYRKTYPGSRLSDDLAYHEIVDLNDRLSDYFRNADGSRDFEKMFRWAEKNDPDRVVRVEAGRAADDVEDANLPKQPPVKNGFGSSSRQPLDMGERGRMERARAQGFDVDTPLYHGTADDFEEFAKQMHWSSQDSREAFFFTTNPKVADQYAADAADARFSRESMQNPAYRQAIGNHRKAVAAADKAVMPWTRKIANSREAKAHDEWMRLREELRSKSDGRLTIPAYARLRNPKIIEGIKGHDPQKFRDILRDAKDAGHDGVIFKGFSDSTYRGDAPADTYAIFDPQNIRGKFAAFDPSQEGSSKLLAGLGSLEHPVTDIALPAASATAGYLGAGDANGDGRVDASERLLSAGASAFASKVGAPIIRKAASGVNGLVKAEARAPAAVSRLNPPAPIEAPRKPDQWGAGGDGKGAGGGNPITSPEAQAAREEAQRLVPILHRADNGTFENILAMAYTERPHLLRPIAESYATYPAAFNRISGVHEPDELLRFILQERNRGTDRPVTMADIKATIDDRTSLEGVASTTDDRGIPLENSGTLESRNTRLEDKYRNIDTGSMQPKPINDNPRLSVAPTPSPPSDNGLKAGPPKAGDELPKIGAKRAPPKPKLPEDETEAALRAALNKARRLHDAGRRRNVMRDNRDELNQPLADAEIKAAKALTDYLGRRAKTREAVARVKDIGSSLKKELSKEDFPGSGSAGKTFIVGSAVVGAGAGGLALMDRLKDDRPKLPDPGAPGFWWNERASKDKETMTRIQDALDEQGFWDKEAERNGRFGPTTKAALRRWREENRLDPDKPMTRRDVEKLLAPKGYVDEKDKTWRDGRGERIRLP